MSRYKPVGNWRPTNTHGVFVWTDQARRALATYVKMQVCDVREDGGHVWTDGAFKVLCPKPKDSFGNIDYTGWPRGRTFIGEYAWRDAERYCEDAVKQIVKIIHGDRYA
jgi:hypothetical protein